MLNLIHHHTTIYNYLNNKFNKEERIEIENDGEKMAAGEHDCQGEDGVWIYVKIDPSMWWWLFDR